VIGKVAHGTDTRQLLYYLYGPGKANEHTDPHVVAGFSDPADLEPERRPRGSRDFRRLAGLLAQPLAALAGPGYAKPVWHCSIRAAPEDRLLSDAEWAQVAVQIMDRTGLALAGDDLGVRRVAIRHAADHVQLVATLARQDGTRPRIWNDFFRVRDACQDAEARFGLRRTAPADRTAARCPWRAEAEQSVRRGWNEPPRVRLRREVCTAAAGARSEQEFFARLAYAGVAVRKRCSAPSSGEVTGYAVGLAVHTTKEGQIVWYGGGKLAADLTLPKLRRRWDVHGQESPPVSERGLSAVAARAMLRNIVTATAEQVRDEAGFFAGLREAGVLVRLRFSQTCPGQVTGYAVGLPGHDHRDGVPVWYGGGRLAAGLTLPRLRRGWGSPRNAPERSGPFRFTVPEQNAIFEHTARRAAAAAEHIRRVARGDPADAADAAWAAADILHVAANALRSAELRRAADTYDRAARAQYGRIPRATGAGHQLRAAARLIAMTGQLAGDSTLIAMALVANLAALAVAVAELRRAQQHVAQAAAARAAAMRLYAVSSPVSAGWRRQQDRQRSALTAASVACSDFPAPSRPAHLGPPGNAAGRRSPVPGAAPSRRAGPRAAEIVRSKCERRRCCCRPCGAGWSWAVGVRHKCEGVRSCLVTRLA
jgi:hypothetical protein